QAPRVAERASFVLGWSKPFHQAARLAVKCRLSEPHSQVDRLAAKHRRRGERGRASEGLLVEMGRRGGGAELERLDGRLLAPAKGRRPGLAPRGVVGELLRRRPGAGSFEELDDAPMQKASSRVAQALVDDAANLVVAEG